MFFENLQGFIDMFLENKYLLATSVFLFFFTLSHFLFVPIKKIIFKNKKTASRIAGYEDLVTSFGRYGSFIIFLIGLEFFLKIINSSIVYLVIFRKIVTSLILLVAAKELVLLNNYVFSRWMYKVAKNYRIRNNVMPMMVKLISILIYVIFVIGILSFWGLNVGPFVASLGVAGIVLGLALKDSLGNVFSGMSLILDRAYSVGDRVRLETGEVGIVKQIGFRSTRILNWDGEELIVPNGMIANQKIQNYSGNSNIVRGSVDVSVAYDSDPEEVSKILIALAKKTEGVSPDNEPVVYFVEMGDFSLKFMLKFWSDLSDRFTIEQKLRYAIFKELKRNNIKIPFPTRTIIMGDGSKDIQKKQGQKRSELKNVPKKISRKKPSRKKDSRMKNDPKKNIQKKNGQAKDSQKKVKQKTGK